MPIDITAIAFTDELKFVKGKASATVQDMEARSNVARDLEWSFLGDYYPCAYMLFSVYEMGQWQQLNTKYSPSLSRFVAFSKAGAYTHDLWGLQ